MLTLDDLSAVLLALDLAHVQRLILVGDPNQLPPIGVGRPFADLVAHIDAAGEASQPLGEALARLTVELRTATGEPSDALRLASWYTRESQPIDADRVLSDLELGNAFNDLSIVYWKTPDELRSRIDQQLCCQLGLKSAGDVRGFNAALGLTRKASFPMTTTTALSGFRSCPPSGCIPTVFTS